MKETEERFDELLPYLPKFYEILLADVRATSKKQ
jgi:hypothetical protein